ncbi:MAG: lysoplasmalogenase [Terrimesophilobacter sp.]
MQKTMPSLRTFVLFIPYLVFSTVHVVALWISDTSLSSFTKPLLMLSLLAAVLFALPRWRNQVALLAALALVFSWAGDVGMAATGELSFLLALGFFLIAHVFYIVLFLRKLRVHRLSLWSLVYLAWWVALVAILAPHAGALLIPVVIYGLVLGTMGALALSCHRWVALGGVLFVVSDTILGLNKFLPGFELWQVDFVIMVTYLAAQGLIALGIIGWAWNKNARAMQASEPAPSEAM